MTCLGRSGAVRALGVDVVDRGQRLVGRAARGLPDALPAAGQTVEHARRRRRIRGPPSPLTASMACRVEPPVVTTSSTIRATADTAWGRGPSMRRCRPCSRRAPLADEEGLHVGRGDGFIDDWDLFLRRMDTNSNGGVSSTEFIDPHTGVSYDAELSK